MQVFTRNPNGVILNANLRAYDLKPGTVLTHRSKHYQVVVGYNLDGKVWLVNRAGRLQRINVSDVLRNYCKRPAAHANNPIQTASAAWEKAVHLHEKDHRLLTRMGLRKHPEQILSKLFTKSAF